MTTKTKSLREIARELEKSSPSTSPSDLADRMMDEIPEAEYGHYLREALSVLAVTYKIDSRRDAFHKVVETSRGTGRSSKVKIPKERTVVMVDPTTGDEVRAESPAYAAAKSYKRHLIKSEWEEFLDKNLPTDSGYILVADATVKDLERAAQIRRNQGKALEVEAKKYDALADVMRIKNAATLGLLTADDVKGML